MANNPLEKARQLQHPAMGEGQVGWTHPGLGEGSHNRSDKPVKGREGQKVQQRARPIKKIIVKPCAAKPQARFERGLMETGWLS